MKKRKKEKKIYIRDTKLAWQKDNFQMGTIVFTLQQRSSFILDPLIFELVSGIGHYLFLIFLGTTHLAHHISWCGLGSHCHCYTHIHLTRLLNGTINDFYI